MSRSSCVVSLGRAACMDSSRRAAVRRLLPVADRTAIRHGQQVAGGQVVLLGRFGERAASPAVH